MFNFKKGSEIFPGVFGGENDGLRGVFQPPQQRSDVGSIFQRIFNGDDEFFNFVNQPAPAAVPFTGFDDQAATTGDAKTAEGETKTAEGETKTAEGETKPVEGETKPAEEDTKKTEGDAKKAAEPEKKE